MCHHLSHGPHPNKEVARSCTCPYGDTKNGYLWCKIMYAIHEDFNPINRKTIKTQWASCQIHKIAGCACPGNAGNVFPRHRGLAIPTCVTHVPWCMSGSLTSVFLLKSVAGERSRHSQRMRNPQFYISGKRPIVPVSIYDIWVWWILWHLYLYAHKSRLNARDK